MQKLEDCWLELRKRTLLKSCLHLLHSLAVTMNGHTSKEEFKWKVFPADFLTPLALVTFLVLSP